MSRIQIRMYATNVMNLAANIETYFQATKPCTLWAECRVFLTFKPENRTDNTSTSSIYSSPRGYDLGHKHRFRILSKLSVPVFPLYLKTLTNLPQWRPAHCPGRSRLRFRMESLEFFIDLIIPATLWPWGRLSLWQKWASGSFLGGNGGRCLGLTILRPSCADCLEIWEPQPPGTLGVCQTWIEISLHLTYMINSDTKKFRLIIMNG